MRLGKKAFLKKQLLRIFFIFLFSLLLNNHVWAQSDDDDPGQDPDEIPLDGGVLVMVAAGIGYGIKKRAEIKQRKTGKNNPYDEIDFFDK